MDAVIADPRIDSVGNVAVRVALTNDGFNYLSSGFTMVERDFTLEMIYLPLRFDEAEVLVDVSPSEFSRVLLARYGVEMKDPVIR